MDDPTQTRSYWRENFERSFQKWERREVLVGLVVILLTALGYSLVTEDHVSARFWAFTALIYLAFLVGVQSPKQMWDDAQRQIANYEERKRPKLSFVFEPSTPPFEQLFDVVDDEGRRHVRMHRIGIRNESSELICNARVVVEAADYMVNGKAAVPDPAHPVLIGHALNVMGIDTKNGTFDIAPSDRPAAYVDVVEQVIVFGHEPDSLASLCYATTLRSLMDIRGRWILTLRIEGGRTSRIGRYVIDGSGPDKLLRLAPYAVP